MNIPTELKYSASDEWVKVEGETATVGITDFAQEQLNDIVYIELVLSEGNVVKKGEKLGDIESAKSHAEILSPISGKVLKTNESLLDDLSVINKDAFGQGWMYKIQISDVSELSELMDATAYQKHCESRAH